jgi:hypothetical protein
VVKCNAALTLTKQPDHHSQMADYYSILAEAVDRLDSNTGMARQQLYQRARSAMISELDNVYPPFRRSEIAVAEIALESAIEKAEAEAVRRNSNRTCDSEQGPPIQVPALPANENVPLRLSLRLCRSE